MDVESLQNSRPRCRCLDVFLVVSVIFCLSMVVALAVVEMTLRQKTMPNDALTYRGHDFAYVRPTTSSLETRSTMRFKTIPYGQGHSVGSHFDFIAAQHSLRPKKTGMYFLYVELNLTCTEVCEKGELTVNVSDLLTCRVNLTESTQKTHQTQKCWTVTQIEGGSRLITKMSLSEPLANLENWKLDLNSSGLGIFRVK